MDIKEVSRAFLEASLVVKGYIDSKLYYNYIYAHFEKTEKVEKQARYRLACFRKSFKLDYGKTLERVKILKQVPMLGIHIKRSAPTIKFKLVYYKSLYAPVDRKKWSKHRARRKAFLKKKKEIFHESMQLMRYTDTKCKRNSGLFFIIRSNIVVKSRPVEGKLTQKVLLLNKIQIRRLWYSLEAVIRNNDVKYRYDCDEKLFLKWKRYLNEPVKKIEDYWVFSAKMIHYLLLVEAFAVVIAGREAPMKKRVFLRRILDFYSEETYLKVLKKLEDEFEADDDCIFSVLKYCHHTLLYNSIYIIKCSQQSLLYIYSSSYRYSKLYVDNYKFNNRDLYYNMVNKVLRVADDYMYFSDEAAEANIKLGFADDWSKLVVKSEFDDSLELAFKMSSRPNQGYTGRDFKRDSRLNRSYSKFLSATRPFEGKTPLGLLLPSVVPLLNIQIREKLIEYIKYYY